LRLVIITREVVTIMELLVQKMNQLVINKALLVTIEIQVVSLHYVFITPQRCHYQLIGCQKYALC
jgi:hypothetical protein